MRKNKLILPLLCAMCLFSSNGDNYYIVEKDCVQLAIVNDSTLRRSIKEEMKPFFLLSDGI